VTAALYVVALVLAFGVGLVVGRLVPRPDWREDR
jgi:hypothetical protein